jgi:hypothetical protein
VAELPDHLDLGRHRDVSRRELGARRFVLVVIAGIAVAALFGVFGQRPVESGATAAAADLDVSAPDRLRGGLFYQGRLTVSAHSDLANATLVLAEGWVEGTSVNTIVPAPTEEASRDGALALSFGPLAADESLVVHLQLQVNPTNVGRRDASVSLYDGETLLATDDRTLTVFP